MLLISRTLTFVIILGVSWHASAVNFRETTKYNPYLFIGRVESASSIAVNVSGNPFDSMGTNNAEATFNLAEIRILKNLSPKETKLVLGSKARRCAVQDLNAGKSYLFFSSERTYQGSTCIFVTGFLIGDDPNRAAHTVVFLTIDTFLAFPESTPLYQQNYTLSGVTLDGEHRKSATVLVRTYAYLEDFMRAVTMASKREEDGGN
jgi:hypothetical protein